MDLSWSNLWAWLQLSDQLEAGQGCPRPRWLGRSRSSSWAQIFHMVRSKCCGSHWEIKHSDLGFVLLSGCHIKIDQVICKSCCITCQLNIPWKRSKAHSADGVILVSLSKSTFMPRCSSNFDPVRDFHSENKYFSMIFLINKNHSTLGTYGIVRVKQKYSEKNTSVFHRTFLLPSFVPAIERWRLIYSLAQY